MCLRSSCLSSLELYRIEAVSAVVVEEFDKSNVVLGVVVEGLKTAYERE